ARSRARRGRRGRRLLAAPTAARGEAEHRDEQQSHEPAHRSILAAAARQKGSPVRSRANETIKESAVADLADNDVVIVEAVRSPLGGRNGGLATVHPADLLGVVQQEAIKRSGIDPLAIGQVVGGCVSQVGEQTFNIARTAWLSAGLPLEVAATTVD